MFKPVTFNLQDGLSPDEAAILAVLRNPELRVARDKHGIANAQLLQAGLLPNPILSYNFAALNGGLDQGKVTGFGLGLAWEITSLIMQSNKITAAEAEQQAVDLQIAWQEWQIAQAAKTAVYKLLSHSKQQLLLEERRCVLKAIERSCRSHSFRLFFQFLFIALVLTSAHSVRAACPIFRTSSMI